MPELSPDRKQRLQSRELEIAQWKHEDDKDVKEITDRMIKLNQSKIATEATLKKIQQDMQSESLALKAVLMPHIDKELRD